MIDWTFDEKDYKENNFELIPVGEHRVRIEEVEEVKSKNGNDMLKFNFSVSGFNSRLFHYLVFMPDKKAITNQNLGSLYASFGVSGLNTQEWIGKVGGVKVKHEMYEGNAQAKSAWFLKKDEQDKLPVWQENPTKKTSKPAEDDTIPF
jgi:Protein of unknown function (DUF669)